MGKEYHNRTHRTRENLRDLSIYARRNNLRLQVDPIDRDNLPEPDENGTFVVELGVRAVPLDE